ncbi:hypothetical protein HQQ81_02660 [Microbacteriaceae bacterium VKM Ac-2854]|nr:hypothetical protein [Microbacteriaceae bacterium VKM Ac-2854]
MSIPTLPEPNARRPIGVGGWLAIGGALAAGVVYTVVLAVLLALTSGSIFSRAAEWAQAGDSAGVDPFDDFDDSGDADPTDPLYDYPGYEQGDSGLILAQPSAEQARATAREALALAQKTLGTQWDIPGDERYEDATNDYGGPSLLHDYSSAARVHAMDSVPAQTKQAQVDRLTEALAPLGFDTVDVADDPEEWAEAGYHIDGNNDVTGGADSPLWIVTFYSSTDFAPYLEFGIVDDADADVLDGLSEWDIDSTDTGLYLQAYAWKLLEENDRQRFIDAMDAFGGVQPYDDGTATA